MKALSIIFSVFISSISLAQVEMFANEGTGTFQNNPASFGNQEIWSVNTFGNIRFSEYYGAPSSFNINAGGLISISENRKHQLIVGGSHSYNQSYFVNDVISRVSLGYRLKWNENSSISIALAPGIADLQYNLYHISASASGEEIYFTEENHGRQFDMSIGAMFNWKTLYTGVSVNHLNSPNVGAIPKELLPTINAQVGYKIPVSNHFIFPIAQVQYVNGFSSLQFMTNYVFKDDLFSLGLGYNSGRSLLLGASCKLKAIRLGYNYNLAERGLSGNSGGTHELRLSYVVRSKKKDNKILNENSEPL